MAGNVFFNIIPAHWELNNAKKAGREPDPTPGIIGKIGTLMGENGINIATMTVGRDASGGTALAILNLDSSVPAAVTASTTAGT